MMNVLKHPSFFRPASRPSSPAPVTPLSDSNQGPERASRPLNKLSLVNFRRASPSPYSIPNPTPLIQDGSYLEMLSLKLSEAVSKSLAQPTGLGPATPNELVSGRRPIPQGRGHALGTLIASELRASQDNPHLQRAILRSLHRPLSVLLTNLSAHVLPLLTSHHFNSVPTAHLPNLNAVQLHSLAIVQFSDELLAVFDELGLGKDNDIRGDGLKSIREGLTSFINRITGPLIGGIQRELMPVVEALETSDISPSPRLSTGAKPSVANHPSIVTLQTLMPIYARALARYTTYSLSQAALATLLISALWKGLLALSYRRYEFYTPPPSPKGYALPKKRRSLPSTPPVTPPASRFNIKLPPSRPPSPPSIVIPATPAEDARCLYELLNLLPRPSGDSRSACIAKEAVDEAFEGLRGLAPLLETANGIKFSSQDVADEDMARELSTMTTDVPSLIALNILLRNCGNSDVPSVAEVLDLSELEYRRGCLSGFGRAEECAPVVIQQVMDVLSRKPKNNNIVLHWLEMELEEIN